MTVCRKTALIFSPIVDGHRQVYCKVLTELLLDAGYMVVIAAAFTNNSFSVPIPHLEAFPVQRDVRFYDTAGLANGGLGIDVHQFRALQLEVGAQLTILAEADHHLPMLTQQLYTRGGRLRGRVIGIFLRTTNYRRESRGISSIHHHLRRFRHFNSSLHSDPQWFHEVLLPRFRLLESALVLDEEFAAAQPGIHLWMPDIYRPHRGGGQTKPSEAERSLLPKLEQFLKTNRGRHALLYFGTAQHRRGFDWLLRLACETDGCLIHCGTAGYERADDKDVAALRRLLASRHALYESEQYVFNEDIIQAFFSKADAIILPYRNHLGSSGVMLQALEAGKRVLVPDDGLMAARVRANGLGRTFVHGDFRALEQEYCAFNRVNNAEYAAAIRRFMEFFTDDRRRSLLRGVVDGTPIAQSPIAKPE